MIKYIVAFFISILTLNALEIETIESFDDDTQTPFKVIENIKIDSTKPVLYKKKSLKKERNSSKKNIIKKTDKEKKVLKKSRVPKSKKSLKSIPQLAIIIDDVSQRSQINFLKNLPYHITPSIFPPTKMNMHSNYLTKNLKHYMVHLPIESHSKAMNKIYKMLFLKDSNTKIRKRVKEIRKLFPKAKYLNNHTGSVFCSNYKKSKVLYKALRKEGFIFLDSRTSKRTKFKRIAKEMGDKYYKSDIYIDNIQSVSYTIKQLKKAVLIAKKRGYAVVIGHPHATTFKALKKAKPLFKGIKTVYIDELRF